MPTTAPQWSLADIQLLPPMSNAFHMSAYKVAMSNNKEKNSLFQRSLIGMDAIYQVEFHDKDLGLRLENHISGRIVVHSVKPHARSGNNTNVELISPGDDLVSVGCIALIPGSTLIQDVVELLCLQKRPIQLTFESHVAMDLKQQMDTTMARLEFNAKTAAAFNFNRPSRELVYQTSLEMIIDFSFSLYAWFDPLRIVHLILFDDALLVAEAGTNQRLRVKFVFHLDLLKVRDLQSSDDYVPSSFQLIHPSRTITFVAQDEGDKRATLDALLMSIALASMERQIILTRGWQYQFLTGSLFESAIHGNIPAIQRIVMRDPSLVNLADVNGWTPLFYAAIRNQPRAIHALCRAGASVNITDSFGLSALHYACMYQRPPSVDALLEHKADVHLRDRHGRTPLFLCAIHEDPILHEPIQFDRRASALCISLLQTAGADINITDNDELTPLERNICVSVAKCRLLLECGAKMELYDNENSLLHLACDSPRLTGTPINPALVDLLLQFGAQPNQVNLDGQTPLDLVLPAADQQPEVLATVELLVSHGACIKQGCISREISNAQLVWRAKRRVLSEAVYPITTSPLLPQSSCYICKAKHTEDLIKMCGACHLSVCADCSTKQVGYLHSKQSNMSLAHYDLPPSVRAERVCDGCFNSAFYAERRKAAMSQRPVRRGRSGSLHASSQFTS